MSVQRAQRWMRSRPAAQRGVAAILLAVSLLALITALGFAIELGLLYSARVDARTSAELVALDTAAVAGGCVSPADADTRVQLAQATAAASLARSAQPGMTLADIRLGTQQLIGSQRVFVPTAGTNADAVSVEVARPLPLQIVPILPRQNQANVRGQAQAVRSPTVTFTVGSFLVSVDRPELDLLEDVFSAALGDIVGGDIVSYQGLLESSIDLSDLVEAANEPSLLDFLNQSITLPGFLQLLADTLINVGDAAVATLINSMAAIADNTPASSIASMAGLPDDLPESAQNARIMTFDLVRNAVVQANPVFSITPEVEIPNLVEVIIDVALLQRPSIGIGPVLRDEGGSFVTRAQNQQASLGLDLNLQIGTLGEIVDVNLPLVLTAAEAEAILVDTFCANADDPASRVTLEAQTQISRLRIDETQPILSIQINGLPIIGQTTLQVFASGEAVIGNAGRFGPRVFTGPFSATDPSIIAKNTWSVNSSLGQSVANALDTLVGSLELRAEVDLPVLGGLAEGVVNEALSPVIGTVLAQVEPALSAVLLQLDDDLLAPVLGALGIHPGGADIVVVQFDVPPPRLIASN